MNSAIDKLLKEGLVDRKKLLLSKYKSVGITEQQVVLLLNILEIEDSQKITVNSISKKLDYSKSETESLLAQLMKSKLIKVRHTTIGLTFDLTLMFEKLLALYYPPEPTDSVDVKLAWSIDQLKLKNTPVVKKQLSEWIEKGGWNRLLSIAEGLSKLQIEGIEFPTLKQLYLNDAKEKSASLKHLKAILNVNWLES